VRAVIQHVSFEIKPHQLDACIEFYELLGFRRVTAPKKLAHYVAWLERDGHQFHLLQLPETSHMNAGHAAVPLGDDYGSPRHACARPATGSTITRNTGARRARSRATRPGT
jgi:hypothetical protein